MHQASQNIQAFLFRRERELYGVHMIYRCLLVSGILDKHLFITCIRLKWATEYTHKCYMFGKTSKLHVSANWKLITFCLCTLRKRKILLDNPSRFAFLVYR